MTYEIRIVWQYKMSMFTAFNLKSGKKCKYSKKIFFGNQMKKRTVFFQLYSTNEHREVRPQLWPQWRLREKYNQQRFFIHRPVMFTTGRRLRARPIIPYFIRPSSPSSLRFRPLPPLLVSLFMLYCTQYLWYYSNPLKFWQIWRGFIIISIVFCKFLRNNYFSGKFFKLQEQVNNRCFQSGCKEF